MNDERTYSYWVVEVDHQNGEMKIDLDATDFWISRIFFPESNVMKFVPNPTRYLDDQINVEVDRDNPDNEYDWGRRIIERAIDMNKLKK